MFEHTKMLFLALILFVLGVTFLLGTANKVQGDDEPIPANVARGHANWDWEADPDEVARIWNVPLEERRDTLALGLIRIWASEVEWANEADHVGIWLTINNIRSRGCNRERNPRITECRNGRETLLSAMRRASSRVMGMRETSNSRLRWIRNIELACEEPEGFPSDRPWELMRDMCFAAAEQALKLIDGHRPSFSVAEPIAWGGRCELTCSNPRDLSTCSNRGACDDYMACRRGLRRIPNTGTANAFWCRAGTRGCGVGVDPICRNLQR